MKFQSIKRLKIFVLMYQNSEFLQFFFKKNDGI